MSSPSPVRLLGVDLLVPLLSGCGNGDSQGGGTVTGQGPANTESSAR
ncbi:MAG: hypothetical protein P1V36_10935 [Planctomycetota bacterium]|nr:hypothetical protein [Planctomycetota bacterium]